MAESKVSGAVWSLLTGVALGAALGLLFAPKSGLESREEIESWLKRRRKEGEDTISEIRERIPS
jgi:gas vesicle protein